MIDPRIAEGVKLVPELERALGPLSGPQYPVTLDIGQCRTIIAALTAAGEMAGERPGWKLVPVEPTNDMVDAGLEEDNWVPIEIYRAMIAAAPASPVGEDVVEKVARAIAKANQNKSGMFNDEQMAWKLEKDLPMYRNLAHAALAAIGRT